MREVVDRAEANRRFADDPLKLERISELGDDEVISIYTDGPFHRPLPRAARPAHRPAQALQAAARRRARTGAATSAARCCSGSTARRSSRRKTSTPTSTGSRRRGSATTAGWARSSTCSCSIPRRRAPRSGPSGAPRSTTCSTTTCGSCSADGLPRDQDAAALQQAAVGDSRATGASTGRTCSSCSTRRRGSTTSRSSR